MRSIDQNNILYLGEVLNTIYNGRIIESNDDDLPVLRQKYKQIFNIPTIDIALYAPFDNRPILQQSFELSVKAQFVNDSIEKEGVSKISRILGTPYEIKEYDTREWHEVRYMAKWKSGDVKLTLSVYGSERKGKNGISNAALFCDIENIENIAEKYVTERQEIEDNYWVGMKDFNIIYRSKLNNAYVPFFIPNYETGETSISTLANKKRIAQKAIYKLKLLETPLDIANMENENVIIWSYKGNSFISCKFDTLRINDDIEKFEYDIIKPARGPGAKRIVIDEFVLQDDYKSENIEKLKVAIEKIINIKAVENEYYNE